MQATEEFEEFGRIGLSVRNRYGAVVAAGLNGPFSRSHSRGGENFVSQSISLQGRGLTGSQAYFAQSGNSRRLPDSAMNLDSFGYGDTFFATASNPERPLIKALQQRRTRLRSRCGGSGRQISGQRSSNHGTASHAIRRSAGIPTSPSRHASLCSTPTNF